MIINDQAKRKSTYLQLRVDTSLKQTFDNLCEQKGYNGSAIIRKLIEKWIEDQTPKP